MIFQWGPNSGIAKSSHCYGLMSSKLRNSGHYSPLESYFNGVKNPGIANSSHCYGLMSSKLQNSSHYSPTEWYFNGVQTLALLILHIAMALWVQNGKIPATVNHCTDGWVSTEDIFWVEWFEFGGYFAAPKQREKMCFATTIRKLLSWIFWLHKANY